MNIYFAYNGKVKTLPINPEELKIETPSNNDNAEVIGIGEINIIKNPKLRPITIESFFPENENPQKYINFFKGIMRDKKPFRIVCKAFNLNMFVSIDGFEYAMRAGEEGDRYYTLELQEWRDYSAKKLKKKKKKSKKKPTHSTNKNKRPAQPKKRPKTYRVKKGDCLWKIAKKYTGKGSRWPELYRLNRKKIGRNPNLIYPNQVFNIPKGW